MSRTPPETDFSLYVTTARSEVNGQIGQMIQSSGAPNNSRSVQCLGSIIKSRPHLFAWEGTTLGRTSILKDGINSGDTPPTKILPRRIAAHLQDEVRKMIDDMLQKNVIRPSKSPWAAPIVLVKKKGGELRLCVDYRMFNGVTKKDAFPLPRIDDLFDALDGATYFSTLDLASGYWKVKVKENDRAKMAFIVPSGPYEFEVMPFGLSNAPATFQRLMQKALHDLIPRTCLVYLDDVIVHGRSEREHMRNLKFVLESLAEVGLKLEPSKCHFLLKEVTFLGHVISGAGIHMDPRKTEQIRSWPTPKDSNELRGFLGLASYYRLFITDFARISTPLTYLPWLQNSQEFTWTEECDHGFKSLREDLCTAPLLAFLDLSPKAGEFVLDTNASDSAIGVVLSQRGQDEENVTEIGMEVEVPNVLDIEVAPGTVLGEVCLKEIIETSLEYLTSVDNPRKWNNENRKLQAKQLSLTTSSNKPSLLKEVSTCYFMPSVGCDAEYRVIYHEVAQLSHHEIFTSHFELGLPGLLRFI
ncbi:uncharacterized protein DEA37_0003141 [Paragonimus westermani]|uniref:Reverse transcriptase domain-containing protein n=1 Tax=Paragonimus westermani TaxID=34504 RepID=A0A5J4N4A2_9TREM|nr:uncharacterized protein DEA37_0003141 [Paragonimus westermani]